jgi:metalloendopeptidase OMA1, mitochondrial
MNTSPKFEAQIGELARRQFREEYRDVTLPSQHTLSQHVKRVIGHILAASNLGIVHPTEEIPYLPLLNSHSASEGENDGWNSASGDATETKISSGEKEWDVMVVNDPKTVNAQVVPGKQ